jgi:hypothetical protein
MNRSLSLGVHALVGLLLFVGTGCPDDGTLDCSQVDNPCTALGATQCAADNTGTLRCQPNPDSLCLEWTPLATCGPRQTCQAGACQCVNTCPGLGALQCNAEASGLEACAEDLDGCLGWAASEACGAGETCQLVNDVPTCATACVPDCTGRVCGSDGCDGSCGTCDEGAGEVCVEATGQCSVCTPDCTGLACGVDPVCGASCGDCPAGEECLNGVCTPTCVPDCQGRECGLDPICGTLDCGSCGLGAACDDQGMCQPICVPDCDGRECGSDGCDGSCGTCDEGAGEVCIVATGTCEVCTPNCEGRECGLDTDCGASCGTCQPGTVCDEEGGVCWPECAGECLLGAERCSLDGLAIETCVATAVCNDWARVDCPAGEHCDVMNGVFVCAGACVPDCQGRVCGLDPVCDTLECGTCGPNEACSPAGTCECVPDCQGRVCGLDPVCGTLECGTCGPNEACSPAGTCDCVPDCQGRVCGLDPVCGTLDCGQCLPGESCQDGLCHGGGDCLPQETLTCGQVANGTNAGAPALIDSYSCVGWDESGPEYVYAFSVPATSQVTLSLGGLTADLDLFVLQGACQPAGCLAYGDQDLTFQAEAGEVYFVVVDGYAGAESPFTLTVACGGPQPEICDDGLDNDGDGAIDCADPDCATFPGCASDFCPGYTGANTCCQNSDPCGWAADGICDCDGTCAWDQPDCGGGVEICDNFHDDDGDGAMDCADPDCAGDPACAGPFDCANPLYFWDFGTLTGTTLGAPAVQSGDCGGAGPEVVYAFGVGSPLCIRLSTAGSAFDTVLHVREDNCTDPAAQIACNDDFGGSFVSEVEFTAQPGPMYYVFVDSYAAGGDYAITISECAGPQPEICDNGQDDDGDGATDCADPDCIGHPACGASGDCCTPHPTPGCDDPAISACVCAQDPYCCDTEWDSYCVDEVTSFGCGACP